MLEIRYTEPDIAAWTDLVFGPVFWLIAFSFLSKQDLAESFSNPDKSFWLFVAVMVYGLMLFVQGVVKLSATRIGRLHCRLDRDGVHFFDRVWYRAWIWSEVDFLAWRDIGGIKAQANSTAFQPNGLVLRFLWKHMVLRRELYPAIIHHWVDKSPKEAMQAIDKFAPDTLITKGKSGRRSWVCSHRSWLGR